MNHDPDRPMKEMEHIRPSGTFNYFTPPRDGCEMETRDNIVYAVHPDKA